MTVSSIRLGISASVICLIAAGVWFEVTDQAANVSHRAWRAQEEYVAAQRAPDRGGSVEAMKKLAVSACYPKYSAPHPPSDPLCFFRDSPECKTDAGIMPEECVTNYIYGDELMYPMTSFFVWQWSLAAIQIIAISAVAGLMVGVIRNNGPLLVRAWLAWLRNE